MPTTTLVLFLPRSFYSVFSTLVALAPRFDYKGFAERRTSIEENIRLRKSDADLGAVLELYQESAKLEGEINRLRKRRNEIAKDRSLDVDEKRDQVRAHSFSILLVYKYVKGSWS